MNNDNQKALQNLKIILDGHDNFYEASVIIGKRAKQVLDNRQESFLAELDSIGVSQGEELPNASNENWREALYHKYEKMPKPVIVAIDDVAKKKVTYQYLREDHKNRTPFPNKFKGPKA